MADTEILTPDTNPNFQSGAELWAASNGLSARPVSMPNSKVIWTLVVNNIDVAHNVVTGLVDDSGQASIVPVQAGDVLEYTGKVLSVGPAEYRTTEPIQVGLSLGAGIVANKAYGPVLFWAQEGTTLLESMKVTEADGSFTVTATVPDDHEDTGSNGACLLVTQAETGSNQPTGGLGLQSPALTITRTIAPEPEPEPEPEPGDDTGLGNLPELVAAYLGKPNSEKYLTRAAAHVMIVTEYVRGYTRGKGFSDGQPAADLQAVIVSAAAKLTYNPEQVEMFRSGDYSERPQQFKGWTLADLAVLNRYRKRWA